jgi:hypothetical protein
MLKKSLIFGSVVFLLVMAFALGGCEGPVGPAGAPGVDGTDGDDGDDGNHGNSFLGLDGATPIELEVAYRSNDSVILQNGVNGVSGVVPAGKNLYITGITRVTGVGLTVNGTLEILEGGILIANGGVDPIFGVSTINSFLKAGSGAAITGEGMIILPYPLDSAYTSGLGYTSPEVKVKTIVAGSLANLGTGMIRGTFGSNELQEIFDSASGPDALNATGIGIITPADGLVDAGVPAKKTLNLYLNNVVTPVTGVLTLSGTNAAVVVKSGGELTIPATCTVTATAGSFITNEKGGIIILTAGDSVLADTGGGRITNDGVIRVDVPAPGGNLMQALDISRGDGSVSVNSPGTVTLALGTDLNQNVVIPAGVTLASDPGNTQFFADARAERTVTIEENGTLDLLTLADFAHVDIINNGTIATATTSPAFLETIFERSSNKGEVSASGTMVARAEDFTVPLGITLDSVSSNFTTADKELIIEGEYFPLADFTPPGNVTVKSTGRLALGTFTLTLSPSKTLTIPGPGNLEGTGRIIAYNATPTNTPKIIIADAPYTTSTTGVVPRDIKGILDVFAEDYEKLTDKVDLASAFGGGKGIGAVQLLNTSPTFISTRGDGANPDNELTITSVIEATEIGAGFVANSDIADLVEIRISTDANGKVQITDPKYTGAVQKYVVVEYTQVRLLRNELYSPLVYPTFHIGVRTNRSL